MDLNEISIYLATVLSGTRAPKWGHGWDNFQAGIYGGN